jgi:hypothetical protein
MGLVDYYPLRTDPNSWQDGYQNCASNYLCHNCIVQFYSSHSHSTRTGDLDSISLLSFISCSYVGKVSGKLCPKSQTDDLIIAVVYPKLRALPTSSLYPEYCRLMLIQHKPWDAIHPSSLSDSDAVDNWNEFGALHSLFDSAFMRALREDHDHPLSLSQMTDDSTMLRQGVSSNHLSENLIYRQEHQYDHDILKSLKIHKSAGIRQDALYLRHVPLDATQLSVVQSFVTNDAHPMLMIGPGGYGKSEVVFRCKELLNEKCAVCATTGKAAALIDGSTIHAMLNLPIRESHKKPLSPSLLGSLQDRWKPSYIYSCNTQGSTFVQNVVIDIGKADKASGLTYVALSRATLDDQIHHCGYPEDRIEKNFKAVGFIARVIEERRCVRFIYVSVV